MSDPFEGFPAGTETYQSIQRTERTDATGRRRVVKLAPWGPGGAAARRRLRTHHIVATGLDITGIARPLTLATTPDGLRLELAWCAGEPLSARMQDWRAEGPATLYSRLTATGTGLAHILAKLAEHGVVHGGIIAEHVLIDTAGEVSLLDFGQARFMRGMAPGRADDDRNHDDDLRALGLLLLEVALGRRVRLARDEGASVVAAACPPELIADIPAALLDVIANLLDAGRPTGYRHAGDAAADLAHGQRMADADRRPPPDLAIPLQRLGRDAEVGALVSAYGDVSRTASVAPGPALEQRTRDRQVRSVLALVDGHSGIGKSSVVLAACEIMQRHGALIGFGKCNQFGDSRPLWALTQALDGVLARLQDEDAARRAHVVGRVQVATAGIAAALSDFLPRLAHLLGPQPEPPPLSAEANQVRFELAVRRLLGALGDEQHPLVLVLDDIHWADPPSLGLIEGLIGDPSVAHMLIIGAYRSEAVTAGHPVLDTIQRVLAGKRELRRITVKAWQRDDMLGLLRVARVENGTRGNTELATMLMAETRGNPFRAVQTLRALYDAGALTHRAQTGLWHADLVRARGTVVGVEAVALASRQLAALPAHTRSIVATGAFLGASFDLETIARASSQTPELALRALWPALRAGMLDLVEDDASAATLPLRLTHDIVQQAAHASVDSTARDARHAEIGRALLADCRDAGPLDERLFAVVHQLNLVAPALLDENERRELAMLNAASGARARNRNAAGAALTHFLKALALVAPLPSQDALLSFTLRREAAEAAYLAARFDTLDALVSELDDMPLDLIDAARVHELRIQGLLARNCLAKALIVGEEALQRLDEPLAALQPPAQWPAIPALAELPAECVADARVDTAMRLLVWLTPCAYITSFDMYARVILTMMRLARTHPASPLTAIAYTNYGLTLCGTGQFHDGVGAGELALQLADRVADEPLRCKVRTLAYGFIQHWRHPVRESLHHLQQTVSDCLRCGDQEYLGYAAFLYCDKAWNLVPLPALEHTHSGHTALVEQFGHVFSHGHCRVWLQFIRAMRGESTPTLTLRGDAFDAEHDIAQLEDANNHFSLYTAHTLSAILAWHRGDVAGTLHHCQTGSRYAMTGGATLLAIDHRLFWCLALLWGADRDGAPAPARAEQLAPLIEALCKSAYAAPQNVAHKLALVEAEMAWADGAMQNAWQAFEYATQLADTTDFVHDRALIAERASAFYHQLGMERLARERLHAACNHYLAWGANAIAGRIAREAAAAAWGGDMAPITVPFDLSERLASAFDSLQLRRLALAMDDNPNLLLMERIPANTVPSLRHLPRDAATSAGLPDTLCDRADAPAEPCVFAQPDGVTRAVVLPLKRGQLGVGLIYAETCGIGLLVDGGKALALHCLSILDALRVEALGRRLAQGDQIDGETGLPNRNAMIRTADVRLSNERATRARNTAAAVIGARNFDEAAIVAGIDYSPAILKELLLRLHDSTRGMNAQLFRIDRLSFGLILAQSQEADLLAFGRALMNALNAPYLDSTAGHITFDIGLCVDDGKQDGSSLVRDAETAFATRRSRGPAELIRFAPETHRKVSERDVLERDLRWALSNSGIRLVFQPIVSMHDGSVLGAEALVRWRHPIRGEVPVVSMIEIAEETGLIRELGRHVIALLIPQVVRWSRKYAQHGWNISFNASPLELQHEDYADFLLDQMKAHGLDSRWLTLEITESTSIQDEATTRENLRSIHDAGVKLSIDDFGVGTSSLSRLHAILADRIKIDRAFIEGLENDPGRRTTVQMIINLAQALDLDIVAEGVGSPDEAQFLRDAGLIKAQGYLYSRPIEADHFTRLLAEGYLPETRPPAP